MTRDNIMLIIAIVVICSGIGIGIKFGLESEDDRYYRKLNANIESQRREVRLYDQRRNAESKAYREYKRAKAKLTPLEIQLVKDAEEVVEYIEAKKRYEQYK